jgi:methyl-accepting chemotaxis protein
MRRSRRPQAGEAGKGFTVLASEVKSLATQTARSTRDIGRHIGEVRSATSEAAAAVARIEQTIGEGSAIARGVASAVEKRAAATTGIAFNVAETASAANEMSSRITEVSAEAEPTEQSGAWYNVLCGPGVPRIATGLARRARVSARQSP